MIKITISYDVPAEKIEEIKEFMDKELLFNCNLSGADYSIERGDHTCIDWFDENTATILLSKIQHIIEGPFDIDYGTQ